VLAAMARFSAIGVAPPAARREGPAAPAPRRFTYNRNIDRSRVSGMLVSRD